MASSTVEPSLSAMSLAYRSSSPSPSSITYPFSDPDSLPEAEDNEASISPSASASTPTLINVNVNEPAPLRLTFSRNSVVHATLYSGRGVPMYRIRTNTKGSRTEVCDLTAQVSADGAIEGKERVVATIKRRELLPDAVVFEHRSRRSLRVSRWLREPKMGAADASYHLQTLFGEFVWKSDSRHRLALYSEGQLDGSPIAYHKKIDDPPTIGLVLRSGFDDIRVEVITSFIELEHRFRAKDQVKRGERLFGSGVYFVAGY